VLAKLHDAGYEGWLVVEAEQDPAVAPSYAFAKKGYDTCAPSSTASTRSATRCRESA
jgi:sugar phosphate isomerase/epimerase